MRLVQSAIHGKVGEQIRVLQAIDKYAPSLLEVEPEGPEEINMMMDYLDWIIQTLPDAHREVIRLRMEDFSVAEIADEVGASQRTVKRVLERVRELIARRLREEDQHGRLTPKIR